MADLDSLFKKPALPSSVSASKKRKLAPSHDPVAAYKSVKLNTNGERPATVNDDLNDSAEPAGDAAPAESSLPSDFFDAPPEDEEGGRFFGGGVNEKQIEILDYVDRQEDDNKIEKIDAAWLRKKALAFERKITKNAEQRGKFEDEPHKFMATEEELDTEIKSWSILSEHPELFAEFRRLGTLGSLVRLLAHENTDIAIDVVEVISELTDDEVEAEPEQWSALVDGMVEEQLLEMCTQNLDRLNESHDSDRSGVYHTLSVFENLASQQSLAERIVKDTPILPWLLKRIQHRESPLTQNKQYSAELLAILLQTSSANRHAVVALDAVDIFLQLLSPYRKRDPVKGGDEEEFVENIFDSLTCVVDEVEGKHAFAAAEGVELVLIMLREGKMSKPRALRLLDHAVTAARDATVAERVVDAAGLKTLFALFMRKQDPTTVEHLLGIFSALLRLLAADSAPRIRTLAKFVERDYEKSLRLLALRAGYAQRLGAVEAEIAVQRKALRSSRQASQELLDDMAGEWLSRRLDAGLFGVQLTDMILAWLCAEDDGARKRIQSLLEQQGQGLSVIRKTLQESMDMIDEDPTEDQLETKDMLMTLLEFV